MHIEIYTLWVKILRTGEEQKHLLCYEVGDTDDDRKELAEKIKVELNQLVGENYKLLGYVSKRIDVKEN